MVADQNKLGLYKRMKLEKVQKELDEIQSAGKESILLIAERLEKELIDQGYKIGVYIALWHHSNCSMEIEVEGQRIGGRY